MVILIEISMKNGAFLQVKKKIFVVGNCLNDQL